MRLTLPYEARPTRGILLCRRKRFLAEVQLDDGRRLTAHCPNPGRMTTCSTPGSEVWLLPSAATLPYRLEVVVEASGPVGVNPLRANDVVERALRRGELAPLRGARLVRREASLPDRSARVDFLLEAPGPRGPAPLWLEVKSATLAEGGVARFPDAVTARGRRHLFALLGRVLAGERAACLFLVQRADVRRFAPAAAVDRDYAEAFATARAHGVEMYAFVAAPTPRGITVGRRLPVSLGAPP